jgi:hypothetical protein
VQNPWEIEISFCLRGVSYIQTVHIADMGHIELLLGMDFLYDHRAVIDLKNNQLLLAHQQVPMWNQRMARVLPVRFITK